VQSAAFFYVTVITKSSTKPSEPEIIPPDHYFVAGEERTEAVGTVSVSRQWGLIGALTVCLPEKKRFRCVLKNDVEKQSISAILE
jgi:hypothetical protein